MRPKSLFLIILALLSFLSLQASTLDAVAAQVDSGEVERTLQAMSVEERIGQLFVVTFEGSALAENAPIYDLIADYHVGGVVFALENNNFDDQDPQIERLRASIQQLQAASLEANGVGEVPLPLLIGIDDRANGWPVEILSGTSPVPSNMALGATWDPEFAYRTGELVGSEMAAAGVNMMMGPNADIVEIPLPNTLGDQGTRVFGGDAYWVSLMVQSYVEGVHAGSAGTVLVFPRHFPGYGAADRLPSVEVPTVRRTQDQLTQSDLKPFYAVTVSIPGTGLAADGLITGHIRYQGFQGDNPRVPTRPISLDAAALPALLAEEPLVGWRAAGGLLVSDALGQNGVKRFYDPNGQVFLNRRVAQDALLAGNDMLYLGFIGDTVGQDETAIIQDTIDFLIQSYISDPATRASIDNSVRRILAAKQRVYGTLDPLEIAALLAEDRSTLDPGDLSLQIAQESLTLLSPSQPGQLDIPRPGESIVIITDTRNSSRCDTCVEQGITSQSGLEEALVRLYGPESSGLVTGANIESYAMTRFRDLIEFGPQAFATPQQTPDATAQPDPVAVALSNAEWVVFLVGDGPESSEALNTLRQFLATTPYVQDNAQIVVFALGAPYYLDSTEVSKLTAYYALYDSDPAALELAARALFQQTPMRGASPVSVPAITYNITQATSPRPDQILPLTFTVERLAQTPEAEQTVTPEVTLTPDPAVRFGDTLRIAVGPVLDRNGNLVPDGTPVDLILRFSGVGLSGVKPLTTLDGIAQDTVVLNQAGTLEISAVSGEARNSTTVQLTIPDSGIADVTVVTPTFPITPTPGLVITPTPTETPGDPVPDTTLQVNDLFISLLGLVLIGYVRARRWFLSARWNEALLQSLPIMICGLLAYHVVGLQPRGLDLWFTLMGDFLAAPLATWTGGLVGIGLVELLDRNRARNLRSPASTTRQRRG